MPRYKLKKANLGKILELLQKHKDDYETIGKELNLVGSKARIRYSVKQRIRQAGLSIINKDGMLVYISNYANDFF